MQNFPKAKKMQNFPNFVFKKSKFLQPFDTLLDNWELSSPDDLSDLIFDLDAFRLRRRVFESEHMKKLRTLGGIGWKMDWLEGWLKVGLVSWMEGGLVGWDRWVFCWWKSRLEGGKRKMSFLWLVWWDEKSRCFVG